MTVAGESTPLQPPLADEDRARAGCYALLSRLFYAGPDQALLDSIVAAEAIQGDSALARAWQELAAAARSIDAQSACLEYDAAFIGTGMAAVTLYATHYLAESGREKNLAGLREELVAMGLARSRKANEPEDHISALFEVMRHLILQGGGETDARLQRAFYDRYIERSYRPLCDAIENGNETDFYRRVAGFARAFLVVESELQKVY